MGVEFVSVSLDLRLMSQNMKWPHDGIIWQMPKMNPFLRGPRSTFPSNVIEIS